MPSANDNRPPPAPDAARLLPILGRVGRDGRIAPRVPPAALGPAPASDGDPDPPGEA